MKTIIQITPYSPLSNAITEAGLFGISALRYDIDMAEQNKNNLSVFVFKHMDVEILKKEMIIFMAYDRKKFMEKYTMDIWSQNIIVKYNKILS